MNKNTENNEKLEEIKTIDNEKLDDGGQEKIYDVPEEYKRGANKGGAKARSLITKSIDEMIALAWDGDSDVELYLSNLYCIGQKVKRSNSDFIYWLTRASEHGNIKAMFKLSTMYEQGDWFKKNEDMARKLYVKGNELSKNNLEHHGMNDGFFNSMCIYDVKQANN